MSAGLGEILVDLLLYVAGASVLIGGVRSWRSDLGRRAGVIYAVLAVAFTAPALLSSRTQVALDYLFQFPPWREAAGSAEVVANPLLSDVALEIGPFRQLVRARLLAGELPLWSHELGTGQPLAGNAQSAPFAPLNLAALPLPAERAMTVVASWHLLVALLGAHLLAASLGAGGAGAALAAVSFAWSVHSTVWLYYPLGMAAAWIPAAVAALLDTWRGRPRAIAALIVTACGVLSSGHPQVALQCAVLAALVTVAFLARSPLGERWAAMRRLCLAGSCVAALCAPVLVAIFENGLESERRLALETRAALPMSAVDWSRFSFALAPLAQGSPIDGNWRGDGNFQERATLYAGLIPTALAIAGALAGVPRVRPLLLAGLAPWMVSALPAEVWQPVGWSAALLFDRRCRVFALLAIAVAAGLSLEAVGRDARSRRRLLVLLGILAGTAVLLVPTPTTWRQDAWRVVALAAAAATALSTRRAGGIRPTIVLAATGFELLALNFGYNPVSRHTLGGAPPAEIEFLGQQTRSAAMPLRIAAVGGRLLPYQSAAAGLWDPRGWDPMRPAAAAQLARERLHRPGVQGLILVRPTADLDFLSFLGVRYLLADRAWVPPATWRAVFSGGAGVIWENPEARRLFFVPSAARFVPSREFALAEARSSDDFGVAILEGAFAAPSERTAIVRTTRPVSNGFEIEVETPAQTLVSSSVTWMPGWSARSASGREVPIHRVQGAYLGFVARPDDGVISLRYAPRFWRPAMAASALALAVLAAVLLRRRRALWLGALVAAGCGASEAVPTLSARLIEEIPQEFFEPERAFGERVVLTLERPVNLPWRSGDAPPPLADLEVDVDAGDVSVLEATMLDMPEGELHLFWRGPGQEYADERHAFIPGRLVAAGREKLFRFPLAEHAGWSGRVSGLRLVTGELPRRRAILERVRAIARSDDPERLRSAREGTWRVSLGDELRSALFVAAGSSRQWQLSLPPGAELRSAYGLLPGTRSPVRFRLVVTTAGGERAIVDEMTISPAGAGRWHDRVTAVVRFSGGDVRLHVEAEPIGENLGASALSFWADPVVVTRQPRSGRPNILLVSIDTLRADAVGLGGRGRPTTPALAARAAARGVIFDSAVAAAPSTLASHASMFTGLDAIRHGAVHGPAGRDLTMVAERMRALGYATVARTGGVFLNPRWGLDQGFDIYRYWLDPSDREREFRTGVDQTLEWLEQARVEPFFLFLHTYEVHAPYRARQPHFEELERRPPPFEDLIWIEAGTPDVNTGFRVPRRAEYRRRGADPSSPAGASVDADLARRYYESSVRFVDAQLERLWRTLDRLDLWRDTLVVVTSDHGEAFGEHGAAGHGYLWDDNLLVPLIVFAPGAAGPRVVTTQVRLVDLAPTLVEFAGGSILEPIDGTSLAALIRGVESGSPARTAWSYAGNTNGGVALRVSGRVKWIQDNSPWPTAEARRELFRLDSDPEEMVDLAASDPASAALEREVFERLRRDQAGFLVELENDLETPVRLRLTGSPAGPQLVKILEASFEGLAWIEGGIEVALPPAGRRELLLERGEAGELRLERGGSGSTTVAPTNARLAIDLAALDGPAEWFWGAAGWREIAPGDGAGLRVRIRRQGLVGPQAEAPIPLDAELIRQLRALGYVQ